MQNDIDIADSGGFWLRDLSVIFILFGILYLGLSFTRPLASPDEGRYVEIPREMVATGDWVTPRLNGMPYFYKPPMFYWMQAAIIKNAGISRVSARAANSLMAVLGICATYCAARALYGRKAGIASAAVLGTSLLYYALGQIVTLDMTVSVFMSAALFCFIVAIKRSGIWRGALILGFFLACAFAVLSKGLIGALIPGAVVFLYAVSVGPVSFLKSLKPSDAAWGALGIALFFAVVAPWHILAAMANPAFENAEGMLSKKWDGQGFFWYYFIHEHILRYVDADTSMRNQPFWFFFVFAPIGLIPWLFVLPQSLCDAMKGGWKNLRGNNSPMLFFGVWVLFVILFFSFSKSKLVPYIIPIYPALAVVVGVWLAKVWENPKAFKLKVSAWLFIVGGYLLSASPVVIYYIQLRKGKLVDPGEAAVVMACFGVCMFVAATFALAGFLKNGVCRSTMALVYAAIIVLFIFFNPMGVYLQRPSAEPLAAEIIKQRKDGDVVVIAFDYGKFQDLPVWLNELTYNLGKPPEEQKFGYMREENAHDKRFLSDDEEIRNFVENRKGAIFIAVSEGSLEDFYECNLPAKKIAENGILKLFKIDAKKQQ